MLKNTQEPIPVPSGPEDASTTLPLLFETGNIMPQSLHMLEKLLRHVYTPLLLASGQNSAQEDVNFAETPESIVPSRSHTQSKILLRDEMLINVQKFMLHLQQTIQQVEGEVKLVIPAIEIEDPNVGARDAVLVTQLEEAVEAWSRLITAIVEEQLKKQPQGHGPLAEVDFWKERNTALSTMYEQLQGPAVHTIIAILRAASSPVFSTFEITRGELNKLYVEAKDNVKFLGTLERHFKNMTHGAGFHVVLDTIPAMMNALRMVWVISRHYNTDERMIPLMERIAWELCQRVARIVSIRTIFKYVYYYMIYTNASDSLIFQGHFASNKAEIFRSKKVFRSVETVLP